MKLKFFMNHLSDRSDSCEWGAIRSVCEHVLNRKGCQDRRFYQKKKHTKFDCDACSRKCCAASSSCVSEK